MNTRVRTQKNSNTEELNPEEHNSNAEEFEHNRSNMTNALRQDHKQEREKSPEEASMH